MSGARAPSRDLDPFDHGEATVRWVPASDAEARAVRARLERGWDLGAIRRVEAHARRSRASSHAWRCETAAGRFVLRRALLHDAARQARLAALSAWLRGRGLPLPAGVPTAAGEPCLAEDDALHALSVFVPGEHFDGSRSELAAAAVLLARLHAELAGCPLRPGFEGLGSPHPWRPERLAALSAAARAGDTPFDAHAAGLLAQLAEDASAAPDASPALPVQLGHFDLHPHNLLFAGPGGPVVALLDLDCVHVGERARDVAIAMHKLARVFGPRTERRQDPGGSLEARARLFAGRYHAACPLSPEERDALPRLAADEARRRILYILERHYAGSPASDFDLPKQEVQWEEARDLPAPLAFEEEPRP